MNFKNRVIKILDSIFENCFLNNNNVLKPKPFTMSGKIKYTIFSCLFLCIDFALQAQTVTTFAGNDERQLYSPEGIATDNLGNIYVANRGNGRICKITPAGVLTTLAGNWSGFADGNGMAAAFNYPVGLAVDASGNVYVADGFNNRIRKITPAGNVSTLAGSGERGFADGKGAVAAFHLPCGVAVDKSGNVYVADTFNERIRKITPAGDVTTLAGNGIRGFADGTGTLAQFSLPHGLALDSSGTIYVADSYNSKIRKITPTGVVTTLAGGNDGGFANGKGSLAQFNDPYGIAVDNMGIIYVTDLWNHNIRRITPTGDVTTIAGGTYIADSFYEVSGYADGYGPNARFLNPSGICLDASNNLYIADNGNDRIRKIQLNVAGLSTNLCGTTLLDRNSYIYSNLVPKAQKYRFRVTHLGTNEIQIKEYELRNIKLSSMSFYQYDQEYKIEVSVKRNDIWENYSEACSVRTPKAP